MSTTNILVQIGLIFLGYFLGSIPPAYLVGRIFFKTDIRQQGSGNVGGANAVRLFGKKMGFAAGAFDVFKGTAAILIAQSLSPNYLTTTGFFSDETNVVAMVGFAAIFGHCYSLFLKFTGGKGGATTAGVLLALHPLSFLLMLLFWIIILFSTRFTSLSNILAVVLIPFLLSYFKGIAAYTNLGYALIPFIIFTHRENVVRLINGNERKFGQKEAIKQS